jgi:hypothetical protein
MTKKLNKIMMEMIDEVCAEGYEEGTEAFEWVLNQKKAEQCMVHQKVRACNACKAFDNCETGKMYVRNKAEALRQRKLHAKQQKDLIERQFQEQLRLHREFVANAGITEENDD